MISSIANNTVCSSSKWLQKNKWLQKIREGARYIPFTSASELDEKYEKHNKQPQFESTK